MKRATLAWALAMLASWSIGVRAAGPADLPRVYTNQEYVEESARATKLDIANPMSTLAFVLGSLPARVKVYPTENYYYFNFLHGGVRYAGNLRLDVNDRDQGKINFAYFEDLAEWAGEEKVTHRLLGKEDGVVVERIDRLVYRVAYGDAVVVFELNDLSAVKPAPGMLGPDERYIGPVFDESGIRFLLVYNGKLKIFHYVLDEQVQVADRLIRSESFERIFMGKRTGFAYYLDHRIDRKLLIGIFEGNARVNNYFDGPFDQLPDNFIEGETLRSAILEVEPSLAGRIDRLGISPGGSDRYMIAPYRHYRTEEDLQIFHDCATSKDVPADLYYGCFVFIETPPEDEDPAVQAPTAEQKGAPTRAANRPAKKAPAAAR